jgi:hypothetical protein
MFGYEWDFSITLHDFLQDVIGMGLVVVGILGLRTVNNITESLEKKAYAIYAKDLRKIKSFLKKKNITISNDKKINKISHILEFFLNGDAHKIEISMNSFIGNERYLFSISEKETICINTSLFNMKTIINDIENYIKEKKVHGTI